MSCFNKSLLICDLASWWILSVLSHKEPKLTGAPLRGHLVISAPPCHTPWLACRKVGPGQIHQLDLILGPSSPTRTPDLFDSLDARPHVPTPHPIPMGLPSSSWMEAGGGGGVAECGKCMSWTSWKWKILLISWHYWESEKPTHLMGENICTS